MNDNTTSALAVRANVTPGAYAKAALVLLACGAWLVASLPVRIRPRSPQPR